MLVNNTQAAYQIEVLKNQNFGGQWCFVQYRNIIHPLKVKLKTSL